MGNAEVRQTVIGSGNIFTATGDVRINYHLPPAEAEERRVLLQLTASVKQFWIAGVLEHSVHEAAMIALRKETRPDAVQHPWGRVLELPGHAPQPLGGGQGILDVFNETGRALLILGEPGAGKTITLLELARDLIDRFEKDPANSAPVVLNLSTWSARRSDLAGWIEAELKNRYFVPPRRSRAWLKASRLVLLLDGLDEVPAESQAACVQSINAFLESMGAPGAVVCSRFAEYVALPQKLRFTGAVCLQPLTPQQIEEFLDRAGDQLAAVRIAIKTDELLQELACSPLLLNVISVAYTDVPINSIAVSVNETVEHRRHQLFERFVQRMFARVPNAPAAFPEAATRRWLSWLASRMREHSLTLFSLDQLQPDWLPSTRDRWRYAVISRTASAFVWGACVWTVMLLLWADWRPLLLRGTGFVVLAGIVAGGIAGVTDGRRMTTPPRSRGKWQERFRVLALMALHAIAMGAVFGVVSYAFLDPVDPQLLVKLGASESLRGWWADAFHGFRSGLFFGLMFGLRSIRIVPTNDIRLADALRVSWISARRAARKSALIGGIAGLILVSGLIVFAWEQFAHHSVLVKIGVVVISAGLVSLLLAITFAIIGAAFGMFVPNDLPQKVQPRHWLRRSVLNAILAGVVVASAAALVFLPWALFPHGSGSVPITVFNCCQFGIAAAVWYGVFDAIQHRTLRSMLARRGCIPNDYPRFLDYAARLIFLQKVGSGYLFVHRQLLDYFSERQSGQVPGGK